MFDFELLDPAPWDAGDRWEDLPSDPGGPVLDVEPADLPVPLCTAATTLPSGWLALELDHGTADATVLADDAVVEAIVGFERVAAWAQARQARLIAEFARRRPGDDMVLAQGDRPSMISRYAPDEIGLALNLARGTAVGRVVQSARLESELTGTLLAWEHGTIDASKVRAICDATKPLSPEKAGAVEQRVLARAGGQSLGQLKAALGRAVIAVDREGTAERHRVARKDRRVVLGDEKEGMASLWAMLPAADAHSCYQWITRLARGLGKDDPRPMDARRADLFTELLTGELVITPDPSTPDPSTPAPSAPAPSAPGPSAPAPSTPAAGAPDPAGRFGAAASAGESAAPAATGTDGSTATAAAGADEASAAAATAPGLLRRPVTPGKPLVHIVMPLSALTGADDAPCELVGYGAIPAETAREIAADAVWRRLVTDPLSGALLDYGRTTYAPPAALADFVRGRDVYCRFPLCRRRAVDSELDHTVPYPDGPTAEPNLTDGCGHHHRLKHHGGWTVTQHPDGTLVWTTPTGHSYVSEPYDYGAESDDVGPPPAATVADQRARGSGHAVWPHLHVADMCGAVPDPPGDGDDPPPF